MRSNYFVPGLRYGAPAFLSFGVHFSSWHGVLLSGAQLAASEIGPTPWSDGENNGNLHHNRNRKALCCPDHLRPRIVPFLPGLSCLKPSTAAPAKVVGTRGALANCYSLGEGWGLGTCIRAIHTIYPNFSPFR